MLSRAKFILATAAAISGPALADGQQQTHGYGNPNIISGFHPRRVEPLTPPPGHRVYWRNGERMKGCAAQTVNAFDVRHGQYVTQNIIKCNLRYLDPPTAELRERAWERAREESGR